MYTQVSKYGPEAQKRMQYRSKGKSCGYYMRIVFFFSSLIQSLIIVSLVLFLVYGKKQDSASVSRIQDLEESFSRLSIENVALRQQRKNLTTLLNATLIEKARNDWDLANLRYFTNISALLIQDMERRMTQCNGELFMCKVQHRLPDRCQTQSTESCNCGLLVERLKARLELVESNFTQTTQRMRMEMDQTTKERDNINLEVIRLRRDKSTHEKEVEVFRQKCKDDFALSLSGVSVVTKAFLEKIDSLFPSHIAFQLTCPKQREHLEQIRTNCSSLSREVEDRFQRYLDSVGEQVSRIQAENSRLKAENWRLSEDYRWCSQNRTGLIKQHRQDLDKLQLKYDQDKENLLVDKMRLNGDIKVLENGVKFKNKMVEHLTEQIKQLNSSCTSKTGFGGYSVGSTSRLGSSQSEWGLSSGGQLGRTVSGGMGSSGSVFNKPASTGTGSLGTSLNKPASTGIGSLGTSLFSAGSSGSVFNKPASTGTGSLGTSLFSAGSSGSVFNKPASAGTGSLGTSLNKPASTGTGSLGTSLFSAGSSGSVFNKPASTGTGSLGTSLNKPASTGGALSGYGSVGSNPNPQSGIGLNKPAVSVRGPTIGSSGVGSHKPVVNTGVKSSSGAGSSSGSTGSTSKSAFSWFGSSKSGQSKTDSGTGKATSSGSSYGTGSSLGAGRTSGLGGGQVSIAQHLKDLQRLINPAGPEEKQDLSRMLG